MCSSTKVIEFLKVHSTISTFPTNICILMLAVGLQLSLLFRTLKLSSLENPFKFKVHKVLHYLSKYKYVIHLISKFIFGEVRSSLAWLEVCHSSYIPPLTLSDTFHMLPSGLRASVIRVEASQLKFIVIKKWSKYHQVTFNKFVTV